MEFPKYWKRHLAETSSSDGKQLQAGCWGWSTKSAEDALRMARQRTEEFLQALVSGAPKKNNYAYCERPFREEVIEEHKNCNDEVEYVITRNSYGALVLNTARIMFIDVDLPELSVFRMIAALFSKNKKTTAEEEEAMERANALVEKNRRLGFRVYRTKAGLRFLATTGTYNPLDREATAMLEALNCDPLYLKLCANQKCFRARLTPKPWRCEAPELNTPPVRFPYETPQTKAKFEQWNQVYAKYSEKFASCSFIRTLGESYIHPDIQACLELHDRVTKASSDLRLA